ncbi:MAG TPA: hypothetical protein VGB53_11580 [Rubricoccaceae bacterium]|jgi:hypothetical protein
MRPVALLLLLALAACDGGDSSDPVTPVRPYTVHYTASMEGDGRLDSLTLTYSGPNGTTLTEPSGALPFFDRTVTIAPGREAAVDFRGIYQVTPNFPSATLRVRVDATRDGVTITDEDLGTAQGTRAQYLNVRASVLLPQ